MINFKPIEIENIGKLSFLILIFLPISFILGSFFVNLSLFIFSLVFFYYFFQKNIQLSGNYYLFFFILIFFIFANIFVSDYKQYVLIKSLSYLRFNFFTIVTILILFSLTILQKKKMIIIFNFIIIFVVIDTLFQFFNKQDIFGFELDYNKAYGRLSGPFGDEFIVGFFLFSIGYINFYLINKFIKSNKLYDFLYLLILPLVIFLSGERATFLSYLLFTSFLIFLNKENRKKILFYNIVLLFSVMLILQNFKPLNNRYSLSIITSTYASYETSDEVTNIEEKLKETNEINLYNKIKIYKELISNTLWFSHFRGAAEIFNNNLFFGSGFKTFRYECRKINNPRSKNIICTSHPHNIYFELVSDTGLAGLLIFIIIVFKFSFDFFKKSNFRNFPSSIIFSLLISFIFPFKPHGSIFTTNYAFMLWFIISFLIYDFYFKNKLK